MSILFSLGDKKKKKKWGENAKKKNPNKLQMPILQIPPAPE